MVCDCVPTRYDITKQEVCSVAEELFGQRFFDTSENTQEGFRGDFILTPNPEISVREQIADLAKINIEDVERYIYLSTLNGNTIIKK